jgi:hypothetical protein
MTTLRSHLQDLATTFAENVLAAIRTASIEDLHGADNGGVGNGRNTRGGGRQPDPLRKARRSGGRLARRSPEEIAKTLATVVSALKATRAKGLRSEEIQAQLKLDKRELPRVMAMGLSKKTIKKKGQKRATVYFAA